MNKQNNDDTEKEVEKKYKVKDKKKKPKMKVSGGKVRDLGKIIKNKANSINN
ncbi:MAG: hypothetical protein U9R06_01975 [Patescibacteria group bacterium]|nr:hypothetical protein [Patescibacteria group bacterium]